MPSAPPGLQTTDATVTRWPFGGPTLPEDSVCRMLLFVLASDHAGAVAIWSFRIAARRIGSGNITALTDLLAKQASAGAALWKATLVFGSNDITVDVQGGVGQTVDWLFTNDDPFCMAGPLP